MMRRNLIRLLIALLAICMVLPGALAETVRGDLDERFSDVLRLEHEGVGYQLRGRLTTVLGMGITTDEQGVRHADYAMVLVVDDNQKIMNAIEIAPNTLVQINSGVDGAAWNMRFDDVFALAQDPHESCLNMVSLVNRMFGLNLIEHYMAFDMEGIKVIGGEEMAQGTTKSQLKALKDMLMEKSTEELNDTYALLGDYIITDLKSGAAVKIVDKADRYEILPTQLLPGFEMDAGEAGTIITPDPGEIKKLVIGAFFEESAR